MTRFELALVGHLAAAGVVSWLLLVGCRRISRQSRALGHIVRAGLLARASLAVALFWISYLGLPVATELQSGGGFWELAPDARGYYELAISAAMGLLHWGVTVPSPLFVALLAGWMSIVGVSPVSGALLNLTLYVALMLLVVKYYQPVNRWRDDLPCIVAVSAFSFSPVLLLHSSLPLKDALVCTLIGLACLGVLRLGEFIRGSRTMTTRPSAAASSLLFAATFGMAGVRWYYAVMMMIAAALVLTAFAVWGRSETSREYVRGCAQVLGVMALAFVIGVGPSYARSFVDSLLAGVRPSNMVNDARRAFIRAGGATNIGPGAPMAEPTRGSEPSLVASSGVAALPVVDDRGKGFILGAAFVFVPISVISAASDVTLHGGRGLLSVVDADTIFQNAAIVCVGVLLWMRRRQIGERMPLVLFGSVLWIATAVLISYVVTNIGTQWRLRLMAMVPLWFVGIAISARGGPRRAAAMQGNYQAEVVEGFGREWARFDQRQLEDSEAASLFDRYFAIFPWQKLPPAPVGFDAGCGSGRWASLVAPRVSHLHCIDASEKALDVARKNLSSCHNCTFHHATVDEAPLRDESMDFGYSLGVLHHVPDTLAALRGCVRKLKPGAPFLLYLYYRFDNRPAWFRLIWRVSSAARVVLSRAPFALRAFICDVIAATVYWPLARLAAVGEKLGRPVDNVPLSSYRNLSFYVMRTDALDRFGTRLEKRFTAEEIRGLMTQAGLTEVVFRQGEPYWVAVGYRSPSAEPFATSPASA